MTNSTNSRKFFKDISALAVDIDESVATLLADMYSAEEFLGTESPAPVKIDKLARISIEQGAAIRKLMRDNGARRSLEIGFAYGFSSVWMLEALSGRDDALHVAVDPFEKSWWSGVGLTNVKRTRATGKFEFIEEFSIHALSRLIRSKSDFDFIYIDGCHRFDDIIIDFYLSDQLIPVGGVIVLDDMWMPSVQKAVSFIANNRSYDEIAQPVANIKALRKTASDTREWNHFVAF
ncbi:class I SAM-dependent methyltransferase [Methylosinus sp. Sm6]|uniref:class I SAM-dependent methyltransferase n=1 Tax=Methylosinus sp. Sm6 TaxID=2866948 RepID=UPI001C998263|nr:class I SAM-dependent methyltransferase [Methylosinus sp. Sm6]MBY6243252.1 class I SAM-dependent methyltransferase [Methylosinus sp. Sm6]